MANEQRVGDEQPDRPMYWEPSQKFLKYAIACLLAGCAAFLAAVFLFAPNQAMRAVGPAWMALVSIVAWLFLRRGRIEATVFVLGFGIWLAVTGLSAFFGGVRSTSITIYAPVIIMLGWLVGKRAAVGLTALTMLITLVFALAESGGVLPLPAPAPPILYWIVQSSTYIFSALLIVYLARSYQKRLEEAHALSRDLAQRVAEVERAGAALRENEAELQSILGATADGILAVDRLGKVLRINQRFAELWRIPQALVQSKDEQVLIDHVLDQLEDPAAFLAKVQALYQSDFVATDTLAFKDGRVFERYTAPLTSGGKVFGRIWSFRDITPSAPAGQAPRHAPKLHS